MIMKLELKHVLPYIPYGLKSVDYFEGIQLIRDVTLYNVGNFFDKTTNAKIILRPLSDVSIVKVQIGEYFCTFEEHLQRMYPYEFIGFNPDTWSYRVVQFLLEYHFDFYSLIHNGLAVDINTLK